MPSPKREVKHDPLPIRSPNHHGTDRRFYRAVPEQEDEAVTEEDVKAFLEANREDINAQVKQRLIDGLLQSHRWEMSDQISKVVGEFMAEEVMPEVKKFLASEKGPIIEAAIGAASQIGDMLTQEMVKKAAKNIGEGSYRYRDVIKQIFE